jgi:hypothetical protein
MNRSILKILQSSTIVILLSNTEVEQLLLSRHKIALPMPEFDDFPNGPTLACIIYNVQCTSTDYLSLFLTSLRIRWTIPVLDRRRQILPEVVLVRRWVIRVLGIWRGEGLGKGLGQGRSVYKQPETEVDGSCHS